MTFKVNTSNQWSKILFAKLAKIVFNIIGTIGNKKSVNFCRDSFYELIQ